MKLGWTLIGLSIFPMSFLAGVIITILPNWWIFSSSHKSLLLLIITGLAAISALLLFFGITRIKHKAKVKQVAKKAGGRQHC